MHQDISRLLDSGLFKAVGNVAGEYSINSTYVNDELASQGLDIQSVTPPSIKGHINFLKSRCPWFSTTGRRNTEKLEKLARESTKETTPTSIHFSSYDELNQFIDFIGQVLISHYILAKSFSMKGSFPAARCGISARNITYSMWEHGAWQWVYLHDNYRKHSYSAGIVSVKNGHEHDRGLLIADPTSNQIGYGSSTLPPNIITFVPEREIMKPNLKACFEYAFPTHIWDCGSAAQDARYEGEMFMYETRTVEFIKNALDKPIPLPKKFYMQPGAHKIWS